MPAKIRLARHGRKNRPFYHIVVADSRAPRDGRYVERIGSYNPNTNPATITLDFEKALSWLKNGAQPTDTVRAILRKEGVLYKRHLLKGVTKGAFDTDAAEKRFGEWQSKNETKASSIVNKLAQEKADKETKRFAAETKKNEERLAKIAEAKASAEAAVAAENAPDPVEEEVTEETVEEVAAEQAEPETTEEG